MNNNNLHKYNKHLELTLPNDINDLIGALVEEKMKEIGEYCPECFKPWEVWIADDIVKLRCNYHAKTEHDCGRVDEFEKILNQSLVIRRALLGIK